MPCGALLLSLYSLFAVLGNLEHGGLYQSIPPTPVYTERPEVAFWQSQIQAPALSSTSGGTGPSTLHLGVACGQPSKYSDVSKSTPLASRILSRDITDTSTWLLFLLSSFDLLCRT